MKVLKRKWGFYSVVDKQGRELAVFGSINKAWKYVRQNKGELK